MKQKILLILFMFIILSISVCATNCVNITEQKERLVSVEIFNNSISNFNFNLNFKNLTRNSTCNNSLLNDSVFYCDNETNFFIPFTFNVTSENCTTTIEKTLMDNEVAMSYNDVIIIILILFGCIFITVIVLYNIFKTPKNKDIIMNKNKTKHKINSNLDEEYDYIINKFKKQEDK